MDKGVTTDGRGAEVQRGDVLQGYGLQNAGRFATIELVGRTARRVFLRRHLDNKAYWTFTTYWRKAENI